MNEQPLGDGNVRWGGRAVEGVTRSSVLSDTYQDSVELMRVAAEIERLPGVLTAALLMGTPANREVLAEAGFALEDTAAAGPNDLIIAVAAEDTLAVQQGLAHAFALLRDREIRQSSVARQLGPRTLAEGLRELPGANLAIISTPGPYATAEALKAIKRGLHVFLFSDNVSIEDEVELKRLARRKGLLMMGPDCGTSILDGIPLGFSNAVRRGRIGLVGASGTGLQQVTCLVDRLGEGVSQAIGVGGRDLEEQVGGLMMLAAIERLAADANTAVLVLVSKAPSPTVARCVSEATRACSKPIVMSFLGADPRPMLTMGGTPAATLEEAASIAVALARGVGPVEAAEATSDDHLLSVAQALAVNLSGGQRLVRGLYSGGTLCQEAALILTRKLGGHSSAVGWRLVDLGSDDLTIGRPHPMIDFRLRNEMIVAAGEDPTTAVILLDMVLGYGAHPDPAAALVPAIEEARRRASRAGRHLAVVASVTGTVADPQNLAAQEKALAAAGVVVVPSNAQAARLAALIVGGYHDG